MVNPLVDHDVINGRSLCWVVIKYLSDQVTGAVRDSNIIGEVIRVHSNSLVGRLDVRGLKGRLSND